MTIITTIKMKIRKRRRRRRGRRGRRRRRRRTRNKMDSRLQGADSASPRGGGRRSWEMIRWRMRRSRRNRQDNFGIVYLFIFHFCLISFGRTLKKNNFFCRTSTFLFVFYFYFFLNLFIVFAVVAVFLSRLFSGFMERTSCFI